MFSDYKVQVVDSYRKKRENNSLSLNLISPTPAKLKKECLLVFQSGRTKSDVAILRQFFGHREDEADYARAIKAMETDKFRPLVNFLKEQTSDTDDKNIELLSWLIDYSPRPYKYGVEVVKEELSFDKIEVETNAGIIYLDQNEKNMIGGGSGSSHQTDSNLEPLLPVFKADSSETHWYQKKRYILAGLGIVGFALLLSFNKYPDTSSLFGFTENESQCMYWESDHYVSTNCDEKLSNVNIIVSDRSKLNHFKKITRPDTLKLADINKVWYSKINKKVEFYTAPGHHPEHPDKQLKPLTKYMFLKYVVKAADGSK
jgi:hypothetical protein